VIAQAKKAMHAGRLDSAAPFINRQFRVDTGVHPPKANKTQKKRPAHWPGVVHACAKRTIT
jgi:hypothetical protein